jgi:hypothetical protein
MTPKQKAFKRVVKRKAKVMRPGMATIEPIYYIGVDSMNEHIILGEGSTPKAAWKDAMSNNPQSSL